MQGNSGVVRLTVSIDRVYDGRNENRGGGMVHGDSGVVRVVGCVDWDSDGGMKVIV